MSTCVYWNGQPVPFTPGETAATALSRSGILDLGSAPTGQANSLLCGIGQCQSCLVLEENGRVTEACLLPCTDGLKLTSAIANMHPLDQSGGEEEST